MSLARYELRREIGSGAMGTVHEAFDRERGCVVAIKRLHPELARDSAIRRRFRREASILRAVDHPGVVRVLDVGEDGETVYTVLELLEGETLESRLVAREPLVEAVVGPIVEALLAALVRVHEQGIVHGDVKPANIHLPASRTPAAVLVDFGLAKIEGLDRLTRTGELAGTPAYMAPELITGAHPVGPSIDLYAVGLVAFEALTAAFPFRLSKHPGQLVFEVASAERPSVASRRDGLPDAWVSVIDAAIATDPAKRPATAVEFLERWTAQPRTAR